MKKSQIARQERNAQLVKDIVEATKPLIDEDGYEDLTIREICANAGITTGMFYRHFVSKDDVLTYCYMQELEAYFVKSMEEYKDLPLVERLTQMLSHMFEINRKFGPASVYMFLNRNTISTSGSFQMRDMLRDCVTGIIDEAVANGYVLRDNRSSEEIFDDISLIIKGFTSDWYMVGKKDIVDRALELLPRVLPALL